MTIPASDYYDEGMKHIRQQNGIQHIPEVMTLGDVADYYAVPFAWLVQLRSAGALPGVCFGSTLHWRCHRQTVYEWMKEHADERITRLARTQRSDPPYPASTRHDSCGAGRQATPHPTA